jgi:outer membrane protein W
MRTLSRRLEPATSLLFMLGMMTLAASSPSAAQGGCPGFDRKHTIRRLGGPNAFAPGGTHKRTKAELQKFFAANEATIRSILASRGLGDEVADALLKAIREDTGITERPMPEGERLEWMAYRKHGKARTIANVCLTLPGSAPAFIITIPMVTAVATARPDCSIDVGTDLQPGRAGTLRVRTAPGARVTMEGPAGSRTIIEGGASTWTGPWEDPYRANYAFTVTNEGVDTETVHTYTFLVPRECFNLAFIGRTEEHRKRETCTDRRTVAPLPPTTCDKLVLDKTEAHRGDVVSYQVTGKWMTLDLELLLDGKPLPDVHLTGGSGTFTVTQPGTYTIVATTTNELGDKTSSPNCQKSVHVAPEVVPVPARWIVRPFGAFLFANGDTSGTVTLGPCPCGAHTTYGYDHGFGLGVSVERLFSDRIGVEARGLYARLKDEFRIEGNGIGFTESGRRNYWDLSLGLNVHLTPNGKVDWYAGPFVGYSTVDGRTSLVVDRSLEYDPEGRVTWGAQTGLDWPFGHSPWSLHGGARYTRFAPDVTIRYTDPTGAVLEQRKSIGLHPITLELGVAYHF